MKKTKKKTFENYDKLMDDKFNLEDRMANIANERWRLNNENIKCGQSLRVIEDQLRSMFKRIRIDIKKEEG